MKLYLVRHAIAEPHGARENDDDRALTDAGRARFQRAVKGLDRIKVEIELVLTSPLRRAVETADILSSGLGDVPIQTMPELAHIQDPSVVVAALGEHSERQSLAIVGHEPGIGRLASFLLTGSPESCIVEFKKGAVAYFDVALEADPALTRSALKWLAPPRILRAL